MASKPPQPQPAGYEDLCSLPGNVVGEIVNGELVVSPRPAPRHALATSYLGGELTGPFGRGRGGPGGWLILFQPELHLGGHVLVPDLAGWLRERVPSVPETAWFALRPDWACEVLSPATAILDDGEMRIPPCEAVAIDVGALWDGPAGLVQAQG